MKNILLYSMIGATLFSCNPSLSEQDKERFLAKGDSITMESQKVLLANVAGQIQRNGVPNAVDFCNIKAIHITDSLSKNKNVEITRLSDKNRNPNNAIANAIDEKAWQQLVTLMKENTQPKHLILEDKDAVYYYKAIPLGMPTCLACHGNKQNEISAETLAVIQDKYPNDKATGYEMGQLRGMWRVKMDR